MSDPTPRDPSDTPTAPDDGDAQGPDAAPAETAADESAPTAEPVGVVPPPGSHPVLRYTLARLGILAAVAAVLYVLGARGLLLLVFAFLISGLIAMVALNRTREGAAYGITSAIRNANAKIDATSRAEDDALDTAASPAGSAQVGSTPVATSAPEPTPAPEAAKPAAAEPIDEWDDPAPR